MEIIIRLVIGLFVLISATFMTMIFGVGGFLFTVGFFGVIWFAFAGQLIQLIGNLNMKIKNFFKKWRDAERNATYLGQALGLLSLYFCYKITEVIVIILFAIILGDGHYTEYGMLAGFIVGFHVYYKILIKYTKIKKTGNE